MLRFCVVVHPCESVGPANLCLEIFFDRAQIPDTSRLEKLQNDSIAARSRPAISADVNRCDDDEAWMTPPYCRTSARSVE